MDIKEKLPQLFENERVIFWYDKDQEFTKDFENLEIPEVEKVKIENNEFGIKYKILKENPEGKFLIYSDQPKPEDHKNWLLDQLLANYEFSAERSTQITQELGLGIERKPLIEEHIKFLNNKQRLERAKEYIDPSGSDDQIKLILTTVAVGAQPEFENILYELFKELSNDSSDKYESLQKYNLKQYFWEQIKRRFNYESSHPTIKDFLHELLINSLASVLNTNAEKRLTTQAGLFLNHWMDNSRYGRDFEELSKKVEKEINLEEKIEEVDYTELINNDTFRAVERKILNGLIRDVLNETRGYKEISSIIKARVNRYWYKEFSNIYEAIHSAAYLIDFINKNNFKIENLKQGIEGYTGKYYLIDYHYRKYVMNARTSEQFQVLNELSDKIEKVYLNGFLEKINHIWQKKVDEMDEWQIEGIVSQKEFYSKYVKQYPQENKKIYVIISDGLRYESAVELNARLQQRDRFNSKIGHMLSSIPGYTQLGIASLLPHKSLRIKEDNYVLVDNIVSSSNNRTRILRNDYQRSIYVSSDEIMSKTRDEGREFVKDYDIIYVYDNSIDATGDSFKTENEVFQKTENAFYRIEQIIRQILQFNGTNILITADHGYLYQNSDIQSTCLMEPPKQNNNDGYERRFALGKKLNETNFTKKFTAARLHLDGDYEVLFPNSINRFRKQGGGLRYVHGGTSLQEIVIPVIEFNKKRVSDVSKVNIDIIREPSKITTNKIKIHFYQTEPVKEKVLARDIKAAFYSKDGKKISNEVFITFDSIEEDARAREVSENFQFTSDVSNYKNEEIYLILREPVEGTNQFNDFKKEAIPVKISFTDDFGDF